MEPITLPEVDGGFGAIVADPPWQYNSSDLKAAPAHRPNTWDGATGGVAAKERYDLMSLSELKELPVAQVAADNAHLYLWTTNSFMVEAHELARAWGFEPKTIITWAKHKQGEPTVPSMKMGYYFRGASEHILFCVRGKPAKRLTDKICLPTWFAHPRLPHSAKPDCSYDMVEKASTGPYLEMFARRNRPGWMAFGNDPRLKQDEVKP